MTGPDRLPAPTDVTLDGCTLLWNYALHPPAFPHGFQVFLNYHICYLVVVKDAESEGIVLTNTTCKPKLNVSHVLDQCKRLNLTVQAEVNGRYSPRSFTITALECGDTTPAETKASSGKEYCCE